METISLREASELELQGALQRLARARAELEFFLSVADHSNIDAESQRHALEVELDEASRQVAHCRDILKGEKRNGRRQATHAGVLRCAAHGNKTLPYLG